MKFIFPVLLLLTNLAWAETSIERAKMYFDQIEKRDFSAAATHFDPKELKEFRDMMGFYKEIPAETQTQFIQTFFGPEQTVASMDKMNDIEFFSGLFKFMMQQADQLGGLSFDKLEILGEVKEGADIAHLVTRNKVSLGDVEIEAMEVISLKKVGKEWRILMSGKIKGIPQQLEAAFAAAASQ